MIELIRMCDLLLSNDSSPVHMAGDSDCWIGLIATCKHPDYILPYRNGSNYYKAEALESDAMYFDYDRRPSTIDGSTIDQCTKERLLQCLPKPERILELAKKI
jgi:ADP-heptose:LPS heptosyltransferase